jgi:hypothetical protein
LKVTIEFSRILTPKFIVNIIIFISLGLVPDVNFKLVTQYIDINNIANPLTSRTYQFGLQPFLWGEAAGGVTNSISIKWTKEQNWTNLVLFTPLVTDNFLQGTALCQALQKMLYWQTIQKVCLESMRVENQFVPVLSTICGNCQPGLYYYDASWGCIACSVEVRSCKRNKRSGKSQIDHKS